MAESFSISGKVVKVGYIQTFGTKVFTKRELVIKTMDGKYEQFIPIEYTGDKCALLDDCEIGDEVTCTFNISGREYNGRYFVNLLGWKLKFDSNLAPLDEMPPEEKEERPKIPSKVKDAINGAGLAVDDSDCPF